jgi:predicted dithiol-disulfide oxidoreductase (DUF899 family)
MAATFFENPEVRALHEEIKSAKARLAAASRRAAYIGAVKDYGFQSPDGARRLSELFGAKRDLVVVHNMGRSCPYCTMWADGLNGLAAHLSDRAGFALTSPDAVDVQREFASSRGWRFPVLSTAGTTFANDMGFERGGSAMPGYSVFARDDDGSISRVGAGVFGPGDDYCAIWPMMEQMAGGQGGWEPRYTY